MPQPNEILARRKEIKYCVAENKIITAITKLQDFVTDFSINPGEDGDDLRLYVNEDFLKYENRAISLKQRFRSLGDDRDMIPSQDYSVRLNKIVDAILKTVDNFIRDLQQLISPSKS